MKTEDSLKSASFAVKAARLNPAYSYILLYGFLLR